MLHRNNTICNNQELKQYWKDHDDSCANIKSEIYVKVFLLFNILLLFNAFQHSYCFDDLS